MDAPSNFRNHSLNVHDLQMYSWLDQVSMFEAHQDDQDVFEVVHRFFRHLTLTFQDQRLGEKIVQETFDASVFLTTLGFDNILYEQISHRPFIWWFLNLQMIMSRQF